MEHREPAMEEFCKYWDKKVRSGESSSISRLEGMMIEIFASWLFEHYAVRER